MPLNSIVKSNGHGRYGVASWRTRLGSRPAAREHQISRTLGKSPMAIQLAIERRSLRFDAPVIEIGRDPQSQIAFPHDSRIARRHATLKFVNGRWIVESRDGGRVRVGDGRLTRFAWLNPGDVIHLTEAGPQIIFEPMSASAFKSVSRSIENGLPVVSQTGRKLKTAASAIFPAWSGVPADVHSICAVAVGLQLEHERRSGSQVVTFGAGNSDCNRIVDGDLSAGVSGRGEDIRTRSQAGPHSAKGST